MKLSMKKRFIIRLLKIFISIFFVLIQLLINSLRNILKLNTYRIVILYYHGISEKDFLDFQKQIIFIQNFANFIGPEGQFNYSKSINVLLTFDDGLKSIKTHIEPFLTNLEIPFLIFIPTGYFGKTPDWEIDSEFKRVLERVMTKEEVLSLNKKFCFIGSHTINHPHLTNLKEDQIFTELVESKNVLEELLNSKIRYLSFPYGNYNQNIVRLSLEVGYEKVFTIEPGNIPVNWNSVILNRISASPKDWKIETLLKLLGGYNWQ